MCASCLLSPGRFSIRFLPDRKRKNQNDADSRLTTHNSQLTIRVRNLSLWQAWSAATLHPRLDKQDADAWQTFMFARFKLDAALCFLWVRLWLAVIGGLSLAYMPPFGPTSDDLRPPLSATHRPSTRAQSLILNRKMDSCGPPPPAPLLFSFPERQSESSWRRATYTDNINPLAPSLSAYVSTPSNPFWSTLNANIYQCAPLSLLHPQDIVSICSFPGSPPLCLPCPPWSSRFEGRLLAPSPSSLQHSPPWVASSSAGTLVRSAVYSRCPTFVLASLPSTTLRPQAERAGTRGSKALSSRC